jgi:hypothetical protein
LQRQTFFAETRPDDALRIGIDDVQWVIEDERHGPAPEKASGATAHQMTVIEMARFISCLKRCATRHFGSGLGQHGERLCRGPGAQQYENKNEVSDRHKFTVGRERTYISICGIGPSLRSG